MLPWWEIIIRLGAAAVLGGIIGWERETRGKPAGLRTLMLVCISAAIYVLGAQIAAQRAGEPIDAIRAMSGIAQGIGFLGAGAILQSRGEVRWLTTAAALWAAAALGLAAGLGMYLIAGIGGVLVFGVLRWMVVVEERWRRKSCQETEQKKGPDGEDAPSAS